LIKKYNIEYVVIGDREKNEFIINQKYFDENFPVAFQNKDTLIYKVN